MSVKVKGYSYGKERKKLIYRLAWLRTRCCRKRCRTGKHLEIPLSCRKRRRRTVPCDLSDTVSHLRLYSSVNRNSYRKKDQAESAYGIRGTEQKMEAAGACCLYRSDDDTALLLCYRRMGYKVSHRLSDRLRYSGCSRQLLYGFYHRYPKSHHHDDNISCPYNDRCARGSK